MDEISLDFFQPEKLGYPGVGSDISETKNKAVPYTSPFATDSVSSVKPQVSKVEEITDAPKKSGGMFATISSTLSYAWGMIFGHAVNNDSKSKADLAITKQDDKARHHFNKHINDMYERILDINDQYSELLKDPRQNKEIVVMKLLTTAIRDQLTMKEGHGLAILRKIKEKQEEQHALYLDKNKIMEELEKLVGKCKTAEMIETAVTIVASVLFFTAFGVKAGGFDIGRFQTNLGRIQNLTMAAKSATPLIQAYAKGSLEDKERESYIVSAKMDVAQDKISDENANLNQLTQEISAIWKILREIAEKQQSSSSAMSRNH